MLRAGSAGACSQFALRRVTARFLEPREPRRLTKRILQAAILCSFAGECDLRLPDAKRGQRGDMLAASLDEFRPQQDLRAIQIGICGGFLACAAYPLAAFAHLPRTATVALVACFGPALGMASFGLRRILDLDAPRITSALGLLFDSLAGALFSAMGLVQMAVVSAAGGDRIANQMRAVWLGLDVAWDAYLCAGTCFFAIAMIRHPRFGRTFAFSGMALAAALLVLHIITFPAPPQNAGLVDLGPAIGLWYFIVTIQMTRSLGWAKQRKAPIVPLPSR